MIIGHSNNCPGTEGIFHFIRRFLIMNKPLGLPFIVNIIMAKVHLSQL